MELLTEMFAKTGIMTVACNKWKDKPNTEQTWENFEKHFEIENKQRIERLTMRRGGYHGANAATLFEEVDTNNNQDEQANAAKQNQKAEVEYVLANEGVRMFNCWSHGLGTNEQHTSPTCKNKKEGHQDSATATNMMGGNNCIWPSWRNCWYCN